MHIDVNDWNYILPYSILYCLKIKNMVLPNLSLLASVSTDKVWQSLLLSTPVIVAGHINLVATQAKKIDENWCLVT